MKNINHYSNIAFASLLFLVLFWSSSRDDIGIEGVVIVIMGWAAGRILKDGIESLMHLVHKND